MRLYLAGIESATRFDDCIQYLLERKNTLFCLSSFYYMHNKQIDLINKMNKENFLLDSGAFTFRTKGLRGLNIDEYTDKYIDFINKYDIKYFFEMDIDTDEESYKKVLELRKRIEEKTGKQCIPVWHDTRGIESWMEIIDKYDYVAIGGLVHSNNNKQKIAKELVKLANKKNTKVHLLGYNKKDLLEYNAYSCDATTWNAGKFGGLWTWDNNNKVPLKHNRDINRRIRKELQKNLTLHNLKVWLHYQKYLKSKGYWRE